MSAPDTLIAPAGDAWAHALVMASAHVGRGLAVEPGETLELRRDEARIVERLAIAQALVPDLLAEHGAALTRVSALIDGVNGLGLEDDQATYERDYATWVTALEAMSASLETQRYLGGAALTFADLLLFAFSARLDGVYFGLFKASAHLLRDLPALHAFSRDLYELPAVHENTDWSALIGAPHAQHTLLNPRGLVPLGGRPELDAPHDREELTRGEAVDVSVEEDQRAARAKGEFVRGLSELRGWVGTDAFPAEAGRYHIFAPFNCPWSHRALLGRSIKGLEDVIGATVVHFRRHPERGWQLNERIPRCGSDPFHGRRFIREYYEAQGSTEGSVPILYDRVGDVIVNNESAELLRMFDDAFGAMATRDVPLYPEPHRETIDRINAHVYQRINNGAYKAGFAKSQHAYERAYHRYFAAFRWLDDMLASRAFLVGTEHPTEADLRLFPTVFRHDAVYFTRFRLNGARLRDFPHLDAWMTRMMAWPGVAEASDLDHARNGYFGRTGNEIVPAGPVPLGLSSKAFPREVWLGE